MKKIFLAAVTFVFSFLAFAADTPSDVNQKVLDAFHKTFQQAADVSWHEYKNYYEVCFKQSEVYARVMYNKEGDIIQSYRYYTEDGLPLLIRSNLQKKYSDKKIFGVTEETAGSETIYHISLQDDKNWFLVDADAYGSISLQKKYKKA